MKASDARAALLEAAHHLFYRQGLRATSIEELLEEAGVARQTLYLHFSTKEGLIAEYLSQRDAQWRSNMRNHVSAHAKTPQAQLLTVFDYLAHWFSEPAFHGCAFTNAAIEYADPQHPFHVIAAEHKRQMQTYLEELCRAAQLPTPEALARQLLLLLDGAIVTAQIFPGPRAAIEARQIAALLLQHGGQP